MAHMNIFTWNMRQISINVLNVLLNVIGDFVTFLFVQISMSVSRALVQMEGV
jgi:hypothetical protein